ncbi:golgin subfamily A member 2-like isoform X1 [Clytia hemisphaerica]|uniref:Golgin subfamily A conserved domain-containing protein n=1 Tax=Clytia hemisphaerica TaxID=252671 RepID=A0A7M5X4D7_9CNID|eukprot:TCONS_00047535-protein
MVDKMSELSRQQKLASAKKKLKKFQQAKSPATPQENGNLSQEILQGLQSNHIFKTPALNANKKEPSINGSSNTNTNNAPTQHTANSVTQKLKFSPLNNSNNDTSAIDLFGGPNSISKSTETVKKENVESSDVQPKNSEVEQMVASYKRSNEQLSNQVGEQRKQILQLQEKVKESTVALQKVADQKALKEQLEVHIQTIGILVSEKSELQSSLTNVQKKLTTKDTEMTNLNEQFKSLQGKLLDFEKASSDFKEAEGTLRKNNKELVTERERISTKLYEVSHQKEELNLQNSELQSKLQMKISECDSIMRQLNELQLHLQNGNQTNNAQSQNLQEEHMKLTKTLEEQKLIVERLVQDKSELLEKNHDTQSHYEEQLEHLRNQVNKAENEKQNALEQSRVLSESIDELQNQLNATQELEPASTPAEVIQPSIPAPLANNVDLDTIKNEKESVERELDIQIAENRRLSRMSVELNQKIETLETTISRLQGESLDRSSLLEQIQSDKDTLSRALQQNKKLKEQLVELEDGFVKMSNSSADLTNKLETEQHGSKDMAVRFSEIKIELEEAKTKLLERSRDYDNVTEELERFKEELHSAQMKLASKEMDVDLLSTELETSQIKQQRQDLQQTTPTTPTIAENRDGNEETLILKEQLQAAEATIQHLNTQNDQLQIALRNMSFQKGGDTSSSEEEGDEPAELPSLPPPTEEVDDKQPFVLDDDETSTEDSMDDMGEQNAIRISRDELKSLQQRMYALQQERERILNVLQDEREKTFNANERLEEHVDLKVRQLTVQRERELQEHFYGETEALQQKVQSLQVALEIMRKNEDIADFDMISDGITMPLLKTAFMQLQKRYKSAMDSKANLSDRIEQLEHMNMRLESETETIGEYITLYQTQRQAMKDKFTEKDDIINRISNEHGRMQTKVTQLHQLVMQMLSERSGYESKNKQLQELVNRRLAQQSGEASESEVPKLQYNLDNLFGEITLTPEDETELMKDNISVNEEDIRRDSITDQTTQQILNIFEQLETTGEGYQHGWLSPAARKHSFLPCRNCQGQLITL